MKNKYSINSMQKKLSTSLRQKIIFLTCSIAVVSTVLVGVANYYRTSKIAIHSAIDQIAGDTRELAQRFDNFYQQITNDAFFVAHTPPIQGIIRSQSRSGIDPLDGSSTELWRTRLETIFKSVMKERPYYTQMRYIGFLDNGKEIVRVDQKNNQLTPKPLDQLQEKGQEPYMIDAKTLKSSQTYISDANFNREHGVIDPNLKLTQRVMVPILSSIDNKMFGVVIINIDYIKLLREALNKLHPPWKTYIVNEKGDYMVYNPEDKSTAFFYSKDSDAKLPKEVQEIEKQNNLESLFINDQSIFYSVRYLTSPQNSSNYIDVVVEEPKTKALSDVYTIQNDTIYLLGGLLVVALGIGAYYGHLITKPLLDMTTKLSKMSDLNEDIDLPVEMQDEIGMLANSLKETIDDFKDSQAKFKSILSDANDSIIVTDEFGCIEDCNPSAERLFEASKEDLCGNHITKFIQRMEIHDATDKDPEKEITNVEVKAKKNDGSKFPAEITYSQVYAKGRYMHTFTIRDSTERKKAEETLQSYARALEQSNHELDQFAYVASHDLKAPLRVIDNASRWLEEDLADKVDEESRENLKLMQGRVVRMERLLDDLLEYSRIGRKSDKRFSEHISGEELMQNIVGLLAPPLGFSVTVTDTFKTIKVMKMPLEQILLNLISNAIKHHDKKGGIITISAEESDDRYTISVKDDGPGIPKEFQQQVFKMFQTLQPRDKVEGSGMGLAMVQKYVESIGESLLLESEGGQGCKFTFVYPKNT